MVLSEYFSLHNGAIRISRRQASSFAKDIAGDFNPLHDTDSRRFCVPGDLLFALALRFQGLSEHMSLQFSGMVGDNVQLSFHDETPETIDVVDDSGKKYLTIHRNGDATHDSAVVDDLVERYVAFSGLSFPRILIPLLSEQGVMINPERPLVIYESMSIDMDRLEFSKPQLLLRDARLTVKGKRGSVALEFTVEAAGGIIGQGEKNIVLGGLCEFDEAQVRSMVDEYTQRKNAYRN